MIGDRFYNLISKSVDKFEYFLKMICFFFRGSILFLNDIIHIKALGLATNCFELKAMK